MEETDNQLNADVLVSNIEENEDGFVSSDDESIIKRKQMENQLHINI